jgi:oxygen-independent coproporphyrinogen III oxidase
MVTSLYIHIPFCESICTYCDFSKLVGSPALMNNYVDALVIELESYENQLSHLKTIHLGGGTPSALPLELLETVFSKLKSLIDFDSILEFGIEANPNNVTDEFIDLIMRYGVNRISLGVESSHPHHLLKMNRSHSSEQATLAVRKLQNHGLTNINLDFIYAWPLQTLDELKADLDYATALKPKHLSFYSLILEPKTKLYHDYEKQDLVLADEETDAVMYEYLMTELPKRGFRQYEISNFAFEGFASKHNLAYWNMEEYLGVGMGAHSQVGQGRFHNHASVKKYLEAVMEQHNGVESPDNCDLFQESFIMGLRKTEGIALDELKIRFNKDPFIEYPMILKNIREGLLEIDSNHLKLTTRGLLLMNYVERSFL